MNLQQCSKELKSTSAQDKHTTLVRPKFTKLRISMFSLSKLPYQAAMYMFVLQIESMIITLCYPIVDQICMKNNHKLHICGRVDICSSNFLENVKYMVWTLALINTNIHYSRVFLLALL